MAPTSRGGGGKLSRRAAIALIAGGGTLAIGGTGAFTQAKTPRRFSVTTAADENALLGIKTLDVTFAKTYETKPILELTNRTGSPLSLTDDDAGISIKSPHNFLTIGGYPDKIYPEDDWDDAIVNAWADSERTNNDPVEVEIKAKSDSTSVTVIHTLNVKTDLALDGCPVVPSVNISVGDNALESQIGDKKITITEGQEVDGDIKTEAGSNAQIVIGENVSITGDVIADGKIDIEQNSEIGGNIEIREGSNGSNQIAIGGSGKVAGNVIADGKIDIEQNSEIGGNVEIREGSNGSNQIAIGGSGTVCGSIIADGKIDLEAGNEVGGNILIREGSNGSNQIAIGEGSKVIGSIIADGKIDIEGNNQIGGNVKTRVGSNAAVDIGEGGTVNGDVVPDGEYSIGESVSIRGADPRPSSGNNSD